MKKERELKKGGVRRKGVVTSRYEERNKEEWAKWGATPICILGSELW